jgi:hypothetical protein
MKLTLKFTGAILCLHLFVITAFAQRKQFIGIWEMTQEAHGNGQALYNVKPGFLKIFNANGTFVDLQVRGSGSVISHGGKYKVNDAQNYTETALYRLPEMAGAPLGKGFPLRYQFSEDKKQITISFRLEAGREIVEVWRRL